MTVADETVADETVADETVADEPADDEPVEDTAGDVAEPESGSEPPSGRRWFGWVRGGRRPVVALLVVAVLLAGLGGWFLTRADALRDVPSSNVALLDAARTAEVSAAVTTALNRIFSYRYDRTEDTEAAADEVLRGSAREAYDRLFEQVRTQAPAQKLVLTSRVVTAAVQELSADRARLLVFLDQSATRADADGSNAAAAQLSVTVRLENGDWVITGMAPR